MMVLIWSGHMYSEHLQSRHKRLTQTSPLMLSVAIHCLLTRWLVLSTRGASILQLHRGSSSSRSVSPASLPSVGEMWVFMMLASGPWPFHIEGDKLLTVSNPECDFFFFHREKNVSLVNLLIVLKPLCICFIIPPLCRKQMRAGQILNHSDDSDTQ